MITIVLHEPQDLVNIAQVVRAMKNFGVHHLRLVNPAAFDPYRIEGIAHRSEDVLDDTRRFDTLDEALADCVHVVAFSARGRTAKVNVLRPRDAAAEIVARSADGPVALLFGREDRGLPNEALDRCHRVVTIPTQAEYSSLNLAHAAALALYEVALARGGEDAPLKAPRRAAEAATAAEVEALFQAAETTLDAIGFFKTHTREHILRTMRMVGLRAPLDQREVKLLFAMVMEARKAAGHPWPRGGEDA